MAHSLQRLKVQMPSMQIYPSGRRARSPIWIKVSVFFPKKKICEKFQKYKSDPHQPQIVLFLLSSCINLFPLFQSFPSAGSIERCVVVNGHLHWICTPVPMVDTVVARPVRSCPIHIKIRLMQEHPVQVVLLVNCPLTIHLMMIL